MKISQLKEYLEGKSDDEQAFVLIYDKSDLESYMQEEIELTPERWAQVIANMDSDDGLWQAASEAFANYVEDATTIEVTVKTI